MKHSIRNKILFWIILTIVTVGSLSSIFAYKQLEQILLQTKKESILAESNNKAKQLEYILDKVSLFTMMLGTRTRVVEYLQTPTQARKNELTGIFDEYQAENSNYLSIYLIDKDGLTHISTDRSFVGVNYGFRPYFKEAMKGTPYMDIALGKTTNKLGYYFSYPVVGADRKKLGVLVVKYEPSALFVDLVDEFKKKDVDIMVANTQGIILYASDKDRELKSLGKLPLTFQQELQKYNPFQGITITPIWYEEVEHIIETYSEPAMISIFDKVDNENELLTVNRIKNYPLYFVTENELDILKNQITDIARVTGVGIFGSALFCVFILSFVIRKLLTPIEELKRYAEHLGSTDFSQDVAFPHTGDELEGLGRILSQLRNNLKEQYENLENKVKERTVQTDTTLAEMQKQKLELEKGRTAILNILEDERQLEEELKIEKQGIEKKVIERTLELANEKSRLTASISSLPQAFLIVDVNNTIVTHNNRLEQLLGDIVGEWTLKKVNSCLSDTFNLEDYVRKVITEKKVIQEREIPAGKLYVSVYIAPVVSALSISSEEVIGAIITITDITEARNLSRSKDEFFSIASHELRTPLTAIRGNTSMILDYYAKDLLNPELKEMIADTREASIRLIGIVNDFLDMSRLELGKMEYKKENILLSNVVKKVNSELDANALKKGVTISSTVSDDVSVFGDVGKIEEILLNLVGNSLKFTENGTIIISSYSEENTVKIEVSDTGRGIPLLLQNLLFHKFQQAGSSTITRDGAKGTGLGLYISRLMAEGMSGKLELEKSVEGKGSVFCLTLPKGS
jgi:signal transduction histidine kinase